MKNSVKLELEQLPGTMKRSERGLLRIETKFFDIFCLFLGFLKFQITAGW
jgi:hypothetical protein